MSKRRPHNRERRHLMGIRAVLRSNCMAVVNVGERQGLIHWKPEVDSRQSPNCRWDMRSAAPLDDISRGFLPQPNRRKIHPGERSCPCRPI